MTACRLTYAPETEAKEVFFHVPASTRAFALSLHGKSRVQHYTLRDSQGAERASAHLDGERGLAAAMEVDVPAGADGAIWSLALESRQGMYTPSHSVVGVPSPWGIAPDRMLVVDSIRDLDSERSGHGPHGRAEGM